MDLNPYGIQTIIRSKKDLHDITPAMVQPVRFDEHFEFPTDSYKIIRKLGEGTYGQIYHVESVKNGKHYAIKLQKIKNKFEFDNTILESIINIILEKESATQKFGPYVQKLYEIGAMDKYVVMRIQMLDGTIGHLIANNSIAENDTLIPNILMQTAEILEFFKSKLKMNHRDLKSDNIMYINHSSGRPQVKLIDLGLSCLTYRNIYFSTRGIFSDDPASCPRNERDLSLLIFELLLDFSDFMSPRLHDELSSIVTFKVRDKSCTMDEFCPAAGLKEWVNAYTFLNRMNISNPHTTPTAVIQRMRKFLKHSTGTRKRTRKFTNFINPFLKTRRHRRSTV